MVISMSASEDRYFQAMHSRLVSVALIFLGSAGPGVDLYIGLKFE